MEVKYIPMTFSTSPHLIAYPHNLDIKLVVTLENNFADLNLQMLMLS